MVDDRVEDGRRIAQLLASELRGRGDGTLGALSVTDVRDVDGTPDGEFAYAVTHEEDGTDGGERVATVYVHEDRARVEFCAGVEAVAEAAREAGLRVRPEAVEPPRTLVFVESGVEAKRVLPVFEAV